MELSSDGMTEGLIARAPTIRLPPIGAPVHDFTSGWTHWPPPSWPSTTGLSQPLQAMAAPTPFITTTPQPVPVPVPAPMTAPATASASAHVPIQIDPAQPPPAAGAENGDADFDSDDELSGNEGERPEVVLSRTQSTHECIWTPSVLPYVDCPSPKTLPHYLTSNTLEYQPKCFIDTSVAQRHFKDFMISRGFNYSPPATIQGKGKGIVVVVGCRNPESATALEKGDLARAVVEHKKGKAHAAAVAAAADPSKVADTIELKLLAAGSRVHPKWMGIEIYWLPEMGKRNHKLLTAAEMLHFVQKVVSLIPGGRLKGAWREMLNDVSQARAIACVEVPLSSRSLILGWIKPKTKQRQANMQGGLPRAPLLLWVLISPDSRVMYLSLIVLVATASPAKQSQNQVFLPLYDKGDVTLIDCPSAKNLPQYLGRNCLDLAALLSPTSPAPGVSLRVKGGRPAVTVVCSNPTLASKIEASGDISFEDQGDQVTLRHHASGPRLEEDTMGLELCLQEDADRKHPFSLNKDDILNVVGGVLLRIPGSKLRGVWRQHLRVMINSTLQDSPCAKIKVCVDIPQTSPALVPGWLKPKTDMPIVRIDYPGRPYFSAQEGVTQSRTAPTSVLSHEKTTAAPTPRGDVRPPPQFPPQRQRFTRADGMRFANLAGRVRSACLRND
ncbi:hypothetical protein FA10DRAFT_292569 [Acaromyces ingoldii]|uniref:Uncharacterized protein n=1 Tax=Acaromyces ingoldii TaxID=215250 RepID=A0A316YSU9_9BASI|nr:hypothetical protein FA10DRAFT_292569 [Acaromyces ingoldii]PWN91748.1 hypothetical protein FA10DRAFT_292569 [Acaromyces ingoldii]